VDYSPPRQVLVNALTAEVGTMRNLPGIPEGNVCGLWEQIKSCAFE
jgi:hypothetical protein